MSHDAQTVFHRSHAGSSDRDAGAPTHHTHGGGEHHQRADGNFDPSPHVSRAHLVPDEISGGQSAVPSRRRADHLPSSEHHSSIIDTSMEHRAGDASSLSVPRRLSYSHSESDSRMGASGFPPPLHLYERSQHQLDPVRDAGKSVSDLLRAGVFRDARRASPDTPLDAKASSHESAGKPPVVQLQLQDLSGNAKASPKPDFTVRKDGTIEVHGHVDLSKQSKIVVELERASGQIDTLGKPEFAKQEQASEDLLKYLSQQIKAAHPGTAGDGPLLQDAQNLVPESVEQALKARNVSQITKDYSPETQKAVENFGRFRGAGHGSISRESADRYFPRRDVPYQKGETHSAAAFKDTVAALFNADKEHPYETVRRTKDGGHAVGRYGLTKHHMQSWLSGLLGHPIDYSKLPDLLAKLEKEGKVPQGFAERFKDPEQLKKFEQLMDKMGGGKGDVTREEVNKLLPKELQETIATDLSKQYTESSKGDPANAALAWLNGKGVKDLTPEDLSDPGNLGIKDAAQKAYSLSVGRIMSQAGDNIRFQDGGDGSPLGIQIAGKAEHVARTMGTVGWCKRGVRQALEPFGIHLQGSYAKDSAAQLANNPRVREVSTSDLRPGDVLVHQPAGSGRTIGQRYAGHIAVYLGNGREASDHVQSLIRGQGYGGTRAFRVVA